MRIKSIPFFLGVLLLSACATAVPGGQNNTESSATAASETSSVSSSFKEISDGTIRFSYPSAFALTAAPDTLPATSAIPPCDAGFAYCVRFTADDYADTNFNSAGMDIRKRANLVNKESCLNAQPEGYTGLTPLVQNADTYSTSLFTPLGDAGAGHFTHEHLYHLFVGTTCYEIRQRIGQSQFANYPAGSIQEFTADREQALQRSLDDILHSITLQNGETVVFPAVSEAATSCGPNNVRCMEGTTPTCDKGKWTCIAHSSSSSQR